MQNVNTPKRVMDFRGEGGETQRISPLSNKFFSLKRHRLVIFSIIISISLSYSREKEISGETKYNESCYE